MAHKKPDEFTEFRELVLARLDTLTLAVRGLCTRVDGLSPRAQPGADDFADIDPERFYTVAELAVIPGREASTSSLYQAMDEKRLVETITAGVRRVKGSNFIAWLRNRPGRRGAKRKAAKVG